MWTCLLCERFANILEVEEWSGLLQTFALLRGDCSRRCRYQGRGPCSVLRYCGISTTPYAFFFSFLFRATDDAVSSKQKALFACLCSINLTDFICPLHPISVSLYPSPHKERFLSSFTIPVVFVATRGRGVNTNTYMGFQNTERLSISI